jgi:hypothetical protein
MNAFSYDPKNGAYLGEVECQQDPLEWGRFITPANATDMKPPKSTKSKRPYWNGKAWELKNPTA